MKKSFLKFGILGAAGLLAVYLFVASALSQQSSMSPEIKIHSISYFSKFKTKSIAASCGFTLHGSADEYTSCSYTCPDGSTISGVSQCGGTCGPMASELAATCTDQQQYGCGAYSCPAGYNLVDKIGNGTWVCKLASTGNTCPSGGGSTCKPMFDDQVYPCTGGGPGNVTVRADYTCSGDVGTWGPYNVISNTCTGNSCTNGATNYPTCDNNNCTNGATNPPSCTTCPSGGSMIGGQCACSNGATLSSQCTQCPSGQAFNNAGQCSSQCEVTNACGQTFVGIMNGSKCETSKSEAELNASCIADFNVTTNTVNPNGSVEFSWSLADLPNGISSRCGFVDLTTPTPRPIPGLQNLSPETDRIRINNVQATTRFCLVCQFYNLLKGNTLIGEAARHQWVRVIKVGEN